MLLAPSPCSIEAPPLKTSLVAPRTPTSCVPLCKAQHAGAIDARRQRQRHLRARGFVDRALQFCGLIVGTAGAHAILRDVAAKVEAGGAARAASGDIASAPATPAADAPMRWRRFMFM